MLDILSIISRLLLFNEYNSKISLAKAASKDFLFSFMAAVSRPDSGVQGSLTRKTAWGISNFCNLERRLDEVGKLQVLAVLATSVLRHAWSSL